MPQEEVKNGKPMGEKPVFNLNVLKDAIQADRRVGVNVYKEGNEALFNDAVDDIEKNKLPKGELVVDHEFKLEVGVEGEKVLKAAFEEERLRNREEPNAQLKQNPVIEEGFVDNGANVEVFRVVKERPGVWDERKEPSIRLKVKVNYEEGLLQIENINDLHAIKVDLNNVLLGEALKDALEFVSGGLIQIQLLEP